MEDGYEREEAHPAGSERFYRFCLLGTSLIAIVGLFLELRSLDQTCTFRCSRELVFHSFFV